MKVLETASSKAWYNEIVFLESMDSCFDPEYWKRIGKVIGSAQGRGTTWFVQTGQMPAALRHYRRGGLFGKIISDTYWFTSWEKTRSFQEFILLEHLIKQGVHVPQPIAARAVKKWCYYRADILTQKIPNAQDLVKRLQLNSIGPTLYRKIGQEVKKLHQANVNHTDLNIHNILIDTNDKVWIIDFDKCHIEKNGNSLSWKKNNLERLLRSFKKELIKRQINWNQESDWQALQLGYSD